jgi:hypothetical protein
MNGPGPLLVDRWPSVRGSLAMASTHGCVAGTSRYAVAAAAEV